MIEFYCKFMAFMTAERDEEGATAVEYGLLVALIAAVIIGVVVTLGTEISSAFTSITDKLPGGTTTTTGS
ncbi:pilus assembly protein Flp/PilA [Nocardioides daedukensis]|uniref:Pilus assembly protein Flp/PilA n=1 Tax=Nocardioides daedukensis TaxID=634462 RepID=A0A7Y9UTF0_9ACTN|nr:Flp family type IVb pilin [Nocardioides daedukensis]NYG58034.1 pilus assembly protein Flp/PilA [Nocardioides daedukensis]